MKAQKYTGPACQKCGMPLPSSATINCLACLKKEPSFYYARSFGVHEGTLKAAVNLFKFGGIRRLGRPLSEKIMEMDLPPVDLVLPVPLHKKRLREREFNQSALMGKHIANRLGAPLSVHSLVRNRHTMPQVGLNTQERRKNIMNAFTVTDMDSVRGKRVMLVDDVYTTGATVRECSRILRKAGAEKVFVITLTHAMSD
jgi:ComF family protein